MYTRDAVNLPNPHVTLRRDADKKSNKTRHSNSEFKRGDYEDPMA